MRRLLALLVGIGAFACVSQTETTASAPIHPATGSSAAGPDEIEIALPERAPPEAERTAPIADGFAWWDRNGDGVLTEDELTDTWIMRLDRDGDGAIARAEWPSP